MNDTLYVLLSKPRVDGVFKFQMSRESLAGFIFRHRFHMRDVLELRGCSLQDFELTKLFPRNQWMSWHFGGDELAELNRALALASYMAECATDERVVKKTVESGLSDEDVRTVLVTLADRYRNLSAATKDAISADVDRLLKRRTEYPETGAYLQGREFPPSDRHDDAT